MRPRAAVLLLGGWLLMTPPIQPGPGGSSTILHKDGPVLTWKVTQAFDTAAECEEEQFNGVMYLSSLMKKKSSAELSAAAQRGDPLMVSLRAALAARCVPAEHIYPPKK